MIAFICCSATFGIRAEREHRIELAPNRARRSRLRYDYFVRIGVIAALLAICRSGARRSCRPAGGDGFLGRRRLRDDIGLGNCARSRAAAADRADVRRSLDVHRRCRPAATFTSISASKAELSFTPAWTGYGFDDDAPVVLRAGVRLSREPAAAARRRLVAAARHRRRRRCDRRRRTRRS